MFSDPVLKKNLETRSEHLKILPISVLVQTWCMFLLDMDISESRLRLIWILSQMPAQRLVQTWNMLGLDLLGRKKAINWINTF